MPRPAPAVFLTISLIVGALGGCVAIAPTPRTGAATQPPPTPPPSTAPGPSPQLERDTPIHAQQNPTRPYAVLALIDSGIDPYQAEFQADLPDPATSIPGYPADAQALHLHLAKGPHDGFTADRGAFQNTTPGKLYWIPGTRIIGLMQLHPDASTPVPLYDTAFADQENAGHGTAVATAALANAGPGLRIVMIQVGTADKNGLTGTLAGARDALHWVAKQPWIDLVSLSLGDNVLSLLETESGRDVATASHEAEQAGKLVIAAAGNMAVPAALSDRIAGPPWVVAVGGVENGGQDAESAMLPDVVANWTINAPSPGSTTPHKHTGTSFAAPAAAGTIAHALIELRATGPLPPARPGGIPVPIGNSATAKGFLTPSEVRAALNASAVPVPATAWNAGASIANISSDPPTIPVTPPGIAQTGWGYIDGSRATTIAQALEGHGPQADGAVTLAMEAEWTARAAVWGQR